MNRLVCPLNGASLPSASQALSSNRSAVVPTATIFPPLAFTSFNATAVSGVMRQAIDVLAPRATQPVSPFTQILLVPGGGVLARVDEEATAFGQRTAPWNTHFLSMWEDPAETEKNIAYTRELANAMKPWTTGRAYLNFIGDEGAALDAPGNTIPGGIVTDVSFYGVSTQYLVRMPWGQELQVFQQNTGRTRLHRTGEKVELSWRPEYAYLLDHSQDAAAGAQRVDQD